MTTLIDTTNVAKFEEKLITHLEEVTLGAGVIASLSKLEVTTDMITISVVYNGSLVQAELPYYKKENATATNFGWMSKDSFIASHHTYKKLVGMLGHQYASQLDTQTNNTELESFKALAEQQQQRIEELTLQLQQAKEFFQGFSKATETKPDTPKTETPLEASEREYQELLVKQAKAKAERKAEREAEEEADKAFLAECTAPLTEALEVFGLTQQQLDTSSQPLKLLKKTYKAKSRICHPDKATGSHELMAQLNQAKETLKSFYEN